MERSLQEMMEHLLARQTEEMKAGHKELKADIKAEAMAGQDMADAKIKARLERMEATMHSMQSNIVRTIQK
jgi:hypothetical protein